MIEFDPSKRITASAALDHPYFKEEEPAPGMKYTFSHYSSHMFEAVWWLQANKGFCTEPESS
jgi:hypothetical protein